MYLEKGFEGRNEAWRYLVSLLIMFFGTFVIGNIPLVGVIIIKGLQGVDPAAMQQFQSTMNFSLIGISSPFALVLICFPFIIWLIAILISQTGIHKRSVKDILTGDPKFRMKRVLIGAGIWLAFALIGDAVGYLVNPDNYVFTFNLREFLPMVLAALILIPIQAGCEELMFRGYLSQGITVLTKRRWAPVLITSLAFMLMHITNPEIKNFGLGWMLPQYFIMGLFLAMMTVLDNGLELAIGVHLANNLYGVLLVNTEGTALQMPSLFYIKEFDPRLSGLIMLVLAAAFLLIGQKLFKWGSWKTAFGKAVLPEKKEPLADEKRV